MLPDIFGLLERVCVCVSVFTHLSVYPWPPLGLICTGWMSDCGQQSSGSADYSSTRGFKKEVSILQHQPLRRGRLVTIS